MPIVSLRYHFRQPFHVPAEAAFRWCTDFGSWDGKLFSNRTRRSVRWLTEDALVMTDTTYPEGRVRVIRRLVRIHRPEMAWTNTHLDGPFRHSQYWYRVVPNGPRRSYLDFTGLRLVKVARQPSPSAVAKLAENERRGDSGEWRSHLAPALERDLARRTGRKRSKSAP